ncbi:MAG: transporter substrate-binding domain-containing protein [Lachnospiraceae bacterium]|nr:transporter substrate-binding domain-containing protein [Lachnospiraceae bacterium]
MNLSKIQKAYKITLIILLLLFIPAYNKIYASAENTGGKVIRIPCGINNLLYYDDTGNVTGYCKPYLDSLAKINNWRYEYIKADWNEAVKMLEDGRIDILFPSTYVPKRSKTMDFSSIIGGYMAPGIFALKDSKYNYGDYESFDGARIAITKSSSNVEMLETFSKKNNFTYTPVYINSMTDKVKALENGEADLAIFNATNNVDNGKVVSVLDTYPFYYTVKKGNKALLSELNTGMEELIINEPDLIGDVFKNCLMGTNRCNAAFTSKERQLITNKQEIIAGFYEKTEPLAYVTDNGRYEGIYIELMNKIKKETGLNISLYPIDRSKYWQDLLKDGTIDFYIGSFGNITSKDGNFLTTSPFMEYETVLVTKNNFKLSDTTKYSIALTKARKYWTNNLPDDFKNPDIKFYKTARECLVAVNKGEADATLLNTIEYSYQCKNIRFAELVQWENYRFSSGISMVAIKDIDKTIYSAMEKALGILTETDISDATKNNLNITYKPVDFVDYIYPSRYILLIIIIILLLASAAGIIIYKTRQKQTHVIKEAQKSEEQQLRIMAALSLDYESVYYIDLDTDSFTVIKAIENPGRISSVNTKEEKYIYSDIMNNYINKSVLPEYKDHIAALSERNALIEHFKNEKDLTVRYQSKPDSKNREYFEMHFVCISSGIGENIMVLGLRCVDKITREEIKQHKALKEAFDAANRANNAKSDFLSRMSHDIRTPMNAIIGMTAIATAHIDDKERVQDSLVKIDASSRHLLALINEVLDMSRIESGKISLNEDYFNLPELINNLLVMVHPQIKKHKHNLQVHIFDIEHENVIGDSLRLQQAFVNIMGNAVKYTPDNGNIILTVREAPSHNESTGYYEFIFEDNGIGMPAEYIEHIFEPFSRVEDVRTSKIQGTGLGMAITQNIIHMMDGDIIVKSEEGKGSKFTITLFLKLQDKHEQPAYRLPGLPVLVAGGDTLLCQSICKMLNEMGMHSEYRYSGIEALELVNKRHEENNDFYAVIMDWDMPGITGFEISNGINSITGGKTLVIILSGYELTDIETEARGLGINLFLNKPVFKSGLAKIFNNLINNTDTNDLTLKLDNVKESNYSGKRLLLVEDNEINREIAAEILGMTGIQIEEAHNGEEAVNKFSASEPGYYDIIFMDVQMPVMNGYEATSAIRSLDRHDARTIPVIAMTANAFAEDIADSKNAGMDEHLAKPIDVIKLNEILGKYLE